MLICRYILDYYPHHDRLYIEQTNKSNSICYNSIVAPVEHSLPGDNTLINITM